MMTNPGITELDKYVDSRYTLVSMVSKRARMISANRKNSEDNGTLLAIEDKTIAVSNAVEEIVSGSLGYVRSDAIDNARKYEQEKMDAILELENEQLNSNSTAKSLEE